MLRRSVPTPKKPDPIALTRRVIAARRAKRIPNVWIDKNSWRIGETPMGDLEVEALLNAADQLWALAEAGIVTVTLERLFELHWIVDGAAIATTARAVEQLIATHRKPAATAATLVTPLTRAATA